MLPQLGRTFRRMNLLSNLLRSDLERSFSRSFQTFDMLENHNSPRVDENTYYRMKMIVDDNGQVKIRTAQKEPGKEWDIQVKEYNRRNNMNSIEHENSKKKVDALGGKKNVDEKVDTKKDENVTTNFKANDVSEDVADTKLESKINNTQKNNEVAKRERSDFDEIESIFDSINRDFEANVRRTFGFFDPFYRFEEPVIKNESKAIEHDKPQKKVETVKEEKLKKDTTLNTSETEPELKKDSNHTHELAKKDVAGFDEIQTIFDNINREFEDNVRRNFSMFDPFGFRAWPESFRYRIEFDPEHTFYNMKSVVNDNGHMKVKTARKEPGKEWDVKEEEFDSKDKAIDEGNSNNKEENAAVEEGKTSTAQITN